MENLKMMTDRLEGSSELRNKIAALQEKCLADKKGILEEMAKNQAVIAEATKAYEAARQESFKASSQEGILDVMKLYLNSQGQMKNRQAEALHKILAAEQETAESIILLENRKREALDNQEMGASDIDFKLELLRAKQLDQEIIDMIKEVL